MTRKSRKWLPALLTLAALVLVSTPRDAHAILVLTGTITPAVGAVRTVYVADNNGAYPGGPPTGGTVIPLVDLDPTVGSILLSPATIFPGYSVQFSSSSVSKSAPPGQNTIFSNALQIINKTGGTVTTNIGVGDNNFIGPNDTANFSASGTWQNAGGSQYNTFFYNDPGNAQPLSGPGGVSNIPGNLVGSLSHTVLPGADSYGVPGSAPVNDPSNFAMTLRFNFTLVNGGTFISRGQNEIKSLSVPEPATLATVFTALPLLGVFGYRRLRRQQA